MLQQDVANIVGFDTSSYARMESGNEDLTLKTLAAIPRRSGTAMPFEPPKAPATRRGAGHQKAR